MDIESTNKKYYRQIARETGISYFKLLNLMSLKEGELFSREEIENLRPLIEEKCLHKYNGFSTKAEIVENLKTSMERPIAPIKTLDDFRNKYPQINFIWWPLEDLDAFFYVGGEKLGDKTYKVFDFNDNLLETDFHKINKIPMYLMSKYWHVTPVYQPLNIGHFFDIHAVNLLFPFEQNLENEDKDKLITNFLDIAKEYVNRLTEQARAEAMEMEALGYAFSRLHDRLLKYVSKERVEELEENINFDEPFMYSKLSTKELYLYYTLHTDVLFCFFQPVWHKFSDVLKQTLVINNFVKNPDWQNLKEAISAMTLIHEMSHTTDTSFFSDTYGGFKKLPEGIFYSVFKGGCNLTSEHIESRAKWNMEKLGFDPKKAALGYLGMVSDKPIEEWINLCSKNIQYLVKTYPPKDWLNAKPTVQLRPKEELEFGVNFINLNKIHPRTIDETLL